MRNLDPKMSPDHLRFRLSEILTSQSHKIVKVHKTLDYAFVHFATRPAAEASLKILQGNKSCIFVIQIIVFSFFL